VTSKQSLKILEELSTPIVRHTVEEEAIVMRVIVHKAKKQSAESIKIAQEHNWILDFIKQKIPLLASMLRQHANEEAREFIQNLRKHFAEEEKVMFPLALRAMSLHGQKARS
jgi:hemerythrin superfamily protein